LIITIHGVDLQQTIHRGPKYISTLCFPFNHASKIIVVSEKLRQIGRKNPWKNDHVVVIPNGINFDDLPYNIGKQNTDKMILSVSNLVHTKGIDFNLYAIKNLLKKHPTLTYNIIGEGAEMQNLKKLVKNLNIEKQVNFLGRKPNNEVLKYMAECTIFCLPSWNESFGIVYLEAMALGKPVIGCKGEGIEDFVEHTINGILVKPKDVDSIVEALEFLLTNPKAAESMGVNARFHVLENYTWDKNAEKTFEVYNEILSK
jgi:glycosyltransferase involved in cell wall biosynthesis